MTPQEKANELVEAFAEAIPPLRFGVLVERDWAVAKECALISVQEVIDALPSDQSDLIKYFIKVKEEIISTQ